VECVGNYFAATYKIGDIKRADREAAMRLLTIQIAHEIGSEVRSVVSHKFDPQGVTAVAIIAESHISVHTFPESGLLTVDVFCCNRSRDLSKIDGLICENFLVETYTSKVIDR